MFYCYCILVGGFEYFLFSLQFGEDFQFDEYIFFKWVETTNQYIVGCESAYSSWFYLLVTSLQLPGTGESPTAQKR